MMIYPIKYMFEIKFYTNQYNADLPTEILTSILFKDEIHYKSFVPSSYVYYVTGTGSMKRSKINTILLFVDFQQ